MVYSPVIVTAYTGASNGAAISTTNTPYTNSGGGAVAPGAGNASTFDNTSPFIASLFVRQTQGTPFTAQNNLFLDYGSGLTDPGWRVAHRWQTTPTTTCTIFRCFNGISGAGTVLLSINITTTGKLQAKEEPTAQIVTSTGSLSAGTWYDFLMRYNVATGAFSVTAYTQGSTTVAAVASMTMATGYSFRSDRRGVSTASCGMGYLDTTDEEVGSGGFPARNDISLPAPTVTADAAIDRVASASVSVHASAAVSGDLVSTLTGAFTLLPPGVTAPALTGTATGTGTTSASLTQTFTPTVAGWYQWTAYGTGASSGLNGTGVQTIYVSPVVGDPVPIRGVITSGYSNVGGAATLLAALTDSNDATYAESPSSPTGTAYIDIAAGPYGATGIKLTPKSVKVGSDATTRTVRVYKSAGAGVATGSAVYTATFALSTTAATPDVIVDGTGLASLSTTDRREIIWRISDAI